MDLCSASESVSQATSNLGDGVLKGSIDESQRQHGRQEAGEQGGAFYCNLSGIASPHENHVTPSKDSAPVT